jgi:hypothetical protein
MPRTAPLAPSHRANRLVVILHMSAALIAEHGTPEAALAAACGLTPAEWCALGQATGHYRTGGTPDDETTGGVLTHLEAMRPAVVEDDAFAGIGF